MQSSTTPLVLLVEDNDTDVFVIRKILSQCARELRIEVLSNGFDALQYLEEAERQSTCPSLILLDLNLPIIGGLEVLKQVRAGASCRNTVVVVVSSSASESDREAARLLGANAYFSKPANLSAYMELANLVNHVLPQD